MIVSYVKGTKKFLQGRKHVVHKGPFGKARQWVTSTLDYSEWCLIDNTSTKPTRSASS